MHAVLAALLTQIESFSISEVAPRLNNIGRPHHRIDVVVVVAAV